MTLFRALICIVGSASIALVAIAQDTSRELEADKKSAEEKTMAMQRAQLLLSDLSNIFECDYKSYDVRPRSVDDNTTYLVVIDVSDDSCDDMVKALNEQASNDNLAFVSERRLPEMKSMPSSEPGLFDEPTNRPMDYTLINEVDPPND